MTKYINDGKHTSMYLFFGPAQLPKATAHLPQAPAQLPKAPAWLLQAPAQVSEALDRKKLESISQLYDFFPTAISHYYW